MWRGRIRRSIGASSCGRTCSIFSGRIIWLRPIGPRRWGNSRSWRGSLKPRWRRGEDLPVSAAEGAGTAPAAVGNGGGCVSQTGGGAGGGRPDGHGTQIVGAARGVRGLRKPSAAGRFVGRAEQLSPPRFGRGAGAGPAAGGVRGAGGGG